MNPEPIIEKSDHQKESGNDLVFSYMTLRNLIGFSGMILPIILLLTTHVTGGDKKIEPSISDYYYSSNGDVLVVILSVLGVFLFTYNGYEWKEKLLTSIAALSGLGVAFSPTVSKYARHSFSVHTALDEVPVILGLERHLIFAALFFLSLSLISLIYFPKSNKPVVKDPSGKMKQKEKRNIIYRICGWTMIACIVVLALYFIIKPFQEFAGNFPVIFVMETIAVEAFAVSWITKGETLFPDGEHYLGTAFRILKDKAKK